MAGAQLPSHLPACSPTSRTDHASASERDQATPASTRVSSTGVRAAEARHHRNGQVGEQDSLRLLVGADVDAPGHRAPKARLRLVGDAHAFAAGVLTEPGDPSGRAGGRLVAGRLGQAADHGDLLTVDGHHGVGAEPAVRQAPGEPFRRVAGAGLVGGLLPAARRRVWNRFAFMNYMITSLQLWSSGVRCRRSRAVSPEVTRPAAPAFE